MVALMLERVEEYPDNPEDNSRRTIALWHFSRNDNMNNVIKKVKKEIICNIYNGYVEKSNHPYGDLGTRWVWEFEGDSNLFKEDPNCIRYELFIDNQILINVMPNLK